MPSVLSLNEVLTVILVAAMPISELRGAIPLAVYYGFSPVKAYVISVLGNLLPVPFLLAFLEKVREVVKKWNLTSGIFEVFERRALKNRDLIEKYGYLGLTLFVAIPLPVTGAWTGALLAVLLELKDVKSLACIALGVAIAGIIVLASVEGFFTLWGVS